MPESAVKYPFNTPSGFERPTVAAQSQGQPAAKAEPIAHAVDRLAAEAAPHVGNMVEQIEAMLDAAGDLDELREMLNAAFPKVPISDLADVLALAQTAAFAGGCAALEDDARD